MTLNRRLCWAVPLLAVLAGVPILAAQAPSKAPARGSTAALIDGQEILISSPQFVVQALWFKSNDETGWYWTGSDEVYAVFSDMDPTHGARITSTYGNVDEGDTVNFKTADQCMSPQPSCDRGTSSLNVRFAFWEEDGPIPAGLEFCPGWLPGSYYPLENGKCPSDDFIGHGSIIYSSADLVVMLPAVGDSREFTAVMDKDAGKYRFRYRITRLANVERSIVIHLPDDILTPPAITLQAMVTGATLKRVVLAWTGATTTNVDIFRNGAIIVTTPNDGSHADPVAAGTYQYRVCNQGSTTACSQQVSVVVP